MNLLERIARAQPEWMARGSCRTPAVRALIDAGRVSFFPEQGSTGNPAKRICAECPVRTTCFDYAVEHLELKGIWGGYGERARQDEHARRARGAVA